MSWYYASGGQQQGPVDDGQFEALIASGQIRPTDLVWTEGMANWQPLSTVRPNAGTTSTSTSTFTSRPDAPPVMGASTDVVCVECGGRFSPDQAVQYGGTWVCAKCKPIFIQKLKEGSPIGGAPLPAGSRFPLGPVDPVQMADNIRNRGYQLSIGSCLSRAWELVTTRLGLAIGVTGLVGICFIGLMGISALCCIGPLVQVAVQVPLAAGMLCFFLRLKREADATMGDAFVGFTQGWLHLVVFNILSSIIAGICLLPAIGAGIAMDERVVSRSVPMMGLLVALFIVGVVPAIYFSVSWMFTTILIIDRQLDFWRAMELSRKVVTLHWWKVFLLMIVMGGIAVSGVLPLCVGLLLTVPLAMATMVFAYEDIFTEPSLAA